MDTLIKEYINLGVLGLNAVIMFFVLKTLWADLRTTQNARIEDMKALTQQLTETRTALAGFAARLEHTEVVLHDTVTKAAAMHTKTQEQLAQLQRKP